MEVVTKTLELGFNKKKTICRLTQGDNEILIPSQVARVICDEMALDEGDCDVVQINEKENGGKELGEIAKLLAKQGAEVKDIEKIINLLEKFKK